MSKNVTLKNYSIPRNIIHDTRGWFLKVIDGHEPGNPFPCEVYFTSAKPGESKGGHYHRNANEWFTLIKGQATLKLTNVESHESASEHLNSDNPTTIFVPPGIAHIFINTGEQDFLLVAYTDATYQPEDTIPYQF